MTRRLFDKHLLKNYSWTGKSADGTKRAFSKFENIVKLYHAIILHYLPTATLIQVKNLLVTKMMKHVNQRAKTQGVREPTARLGSKKKVGGTEISTSAERLKNLVDEDTEDELSDETPLQDRKKQKQK